MQSMNHIEIRVGQPGYAPIAGAEHKCRVIEVKRTIVVVTPIDGLQLALDGPGAAAVDPSKFYALEA